MLEALLEKLRCYRGYGTGAAAALNEDCLGKILRENRNAFGPLVDVFGRTDGSRDVEDAIRRFAQLSAPLAAKAVEDTAFYRYGRLLSRNDVGFNPRRHTLDIATFHQRMAIRSAKWPHAMLATATHDHKRGEDARARLAVLSEVPEKWVAFVDTAPQVRGLDGADLYFLYQTLFGAWPDERADGVFVTRIQNWCRKYLREAKLRSSWEAPNNSYENRFCEHAHALILGVECAAFRQGMSSLLVELRPAIETKVLIQTMLRNTVPGVPDLYQGCEWEDLSMVDPDNRRPVDFEGRTTSLSSGKHRKQRLIASILRARSGDPNLWAKGDYRGLSAGENILAFTRSYDNTCLIAVAALRGGPVQLWEEKIELTHSAYDLITGTSFEKGLYPVPELLGGETVRILYGARSRASNHGRQLDRLLRG
jgi:(1->4)-alpha-D-glucan 1-alpha-D-glucosylmutase